ncbi:hypothetical protein F183_A23880 [Bryobacterales bacterium F-183]|nr:hypothetical protein F183_A23880 [Bryobacterales bacterium F-183]
MRTHLVVLSSVFLWSCGTPAEKSVPSPDKADTSVKPPVITQFYSDPSVTHAGAGPVNLCYGTESATEVTLDPPVERLWPAMTRCFGVKPSATTTYTLTARNAAGTSVSQKTMVQVGPPSAKIVEVSVESLEIPKGSPFNFCVRAVNVVKWEISGGGWIKGPDSHGGCASDIPQATTTYTIKAIGGLGEVDSERVTVKVK